MPATVATPISGAALSWLVPNANQVRVAEQLDHGRIGSGHRRHYTVGEAIAVLTMWNNIVASTELRSAAMCAIAEAVDYHMDWQDAPFLAVTVEADPAFAVGDSIEAALAGIGPTRAGKLLVLIDVGAAILAMFDRLHLPVPPKGP